MLDGTFECLHISFEGVEMVFFSCLLLDAAGGDLGVDEVSKAVSSPDLDETEATYGTEPVQRLLEVTGSVVSVECEEAAYRHAPADGAEGVLVAEDALGLQGGVLHVALVRVVLEQVLVWRLVLGDVLSPELVHLRHAVHVSLGSLIKPILALPERFVRQTRFIVQWNTLSLLFFKSLLSTCSCGMFYHYN